MKNPTVFYFDPAGYISFTTSILTVLSLRVKDRHLGSPRRDLTCAVESLKMSIGMILYDLIPIAPSFQLEGVFYFIFR